MKNLIFAAVIFMFIAPTVVFYINGGRVKMSKIILKNGVLIAKSTGVVIKPL